MIGKAIPGLVCAVILAALAAAAPAGSIWRKTHDGARAIHADDTARKVGDILTITISEHSVIENESERKMDKSSARSGSIESNMDLLKAFNILTGKLFSLEDLSLDVDAESSFQGGADFSSDRELTDKITVTVTDVLPNGNLVVIGSRRRMVQGDAQIVEVSGIVRPSDISFSNTVSSEQVADFKIVFKHAGQEKLFTNPGWLDRILNLVNPF